MGTFVLDGLVSISSSSCRAILITGILLDTRDADNYLSSFYSHRALRVLPLYYASVLFFFEIYPLIGPHLGFGRPHISSTNRSGLLAYLELADCFLSRAIHTCYSLLAPQSRYGTLGRTSFLSVTGRCCFGCRRNLYFGHYCGAISYFYPVSGYESFRIQFAGCHLWWGC